MEKILIIQTAFIGDVVLATSLIESIKSSEKDYSVDFLVRKGNESLLENNPHIGRVLIFDKNQKKYENMFRLIRDIRSSSYDFIINVQRFLTTGIITALSGAVIKIGFKKNPLSFVFNHAVAHHIELKAGGPHEIERNFELLKPIGDFHLKKPRLYPSPTDFQIVPDNKNFICIAPSSVWFTKQFPISKWIELIGYIPPEFKIIFLGAKSDWERCEEILKRTNRKNLENHAGKYSFLQSAALIAKAKMTFTNDSAPLHFASAVNAPVTAVFCSTVPEFGFGPLSEKSYLLEVEENLDCRPCGLHGKKACPKGHFKCADIDVENAMKKINI